MLTEYLFKLNHQYLIIIITIQNEKIVESIQERKPSKTKKNNKCLIKILKVEMNFDFLFVY